MGVPNARWLSKYLSQYEISMPLKFAYYLEFEIDSMLQESK